MLHIEEKESSKKHVEMKSAHNPCCSGRGLEQQFGAGVPREVRKNFFRGKKETIISLLAEYVTACTVNNVVNLYIHNKLG